MRKIAIVSTVAIIAALLSAPVGWAQSSDDVDAEVADESSSLGQTMAGEEADAAANMEQMDDAMQGNETPVGPAGDE